MTDQTPSIPPSESDPRTPPAAHQGWAQRRREKVAAEVDRNRRGEFAVPTWVLVAALVAVVGAWAALIIFG